MNFQIEPGKSYHLRTPDFWDKKVHIDYIIKNPTEPELWQLNLVIYRIWLFRKKRWEHRCDPYYVLAIYNKWDYNERDLHNTD